MNNATFQTVTAAGLSITIFLGVTLIGLSPVFLLLAAAPLMALGLTAAFRPLLAASLLTALSLAALDSDSALFFAGYLALPTLLFTPQLSLRRQGEWYPIGLALSDLALYAAVYFLAVEWALGAAGGIQGYLIAMLEGAGDRIDPAIIASMGWLFTDHQYLLVGMGVWWSVLVFYLTASLTNIFLVSRQLAVRPNLALAPFQPPLWMLAVLIISAVAGEAGEGQAQFIARSLLIIFLLPYFFSGAMNAPFRIARENRGLWLFLVYFLTLTLAWPALIVAGVGLWQQSRLLFGRKEEL